MDDKLLQPGERAPDFALPAVQRAGMVALDDYRGRTSLLLGFFRGLNCPFCRRLIAQLGALQPELNLSGVECAGIIATPVERARLYARYYPAKLPLASDVDGVTHGAYGVPKFVVVADSGGERPQWPHSVSESQLGSLRVNPQGELPEALSVDEAATILNRKDGFKASEEDKQVSAKHWNQLGGLFLIDMAGVVRWRAVEAADNPALLGSFPSSDELLRVAAMK